MLALDNINTCRTLSYPLRTPLDEIQLLNNGINSIDITGPEGATRGVLVIYDIFGFRHQTFQGADTLAESHERKYKVFMPDWFDGKPCPANLCV